MACRGSEELVPAAGTRAAALIGALIDVVTLVPPTTTAPYIVSEARVLSRNRFHSGRTADATKQV
ncbi:hypothetical protein [Lentzea jiangxiensis]|uniref:Uncharacterized protein n=1 Tax=Lentzea jiangxiensis TaxID=641025 RepID=A0A1H0PJV7_9PSEU|nr:hypothetical protein [Lentzea jiangxiensis]SDP04928.1 hypothetical protein SAMN05421507_10577 [Lentzea jiangxiensis]